MDGVFPDAGKDVVAAMLALAESQELRRRAEERCRGWLCSSSDPGELRGWLLAEIEVHFERCALVFDHGTLGYPFVETRLGLYVADPSGAFFRGLRPVGHYRLITRLDGGADDDYFVLDVEKRTERSGRATRPRD